MRNKITLIQTLPNVRKFEYFIHSYTHHFRIQTQHILIPSLSDIALTPIPQPLAPSGPPGRLHARRNSFNSRSGRGPRLPPQQLHPHYSPGTFGRKPFVRIPDFHQIFSHPLSRRLDPSAVVPLAPPPSRAESPGPSFSDS